MIFEARPPITQEVLAALARGMENAAITAKIDPKILEARKRFLNLFDGNGPNPPQPIGEAPVCDCNGGASGNGRLNDCKRRGEEAVFDKWDPFFPGSTLVAGADGQPELAQWKPFQKGDHKYWGWVCEGSHDKGVEGLGIYADGLNPAAAEVDMYGNLIQELPLGISESAEDSQLPVVTIEATKTQVPTETPAPTIVPSITNIPTENIVIPISDKNRDENLNTMLKTLGLSICGGMLLFFGIPLAARLAGARRSNNPEGDASRDFNNQRPERLRKTQSQIQKGMDRRVQKIENTANQKVQNERNRIQRQYERDHALGEKKVSLANQLIERLKSSIDQANERAKLAQEAYLQTIKARDEAQGITRAANRKTDEAERAVGQANRQVNTAAQIAATQIIIAEQERLKALRIQQELAQAQKKIKNIAPEITRRPEEPINIIEDDSRRTETRQNIDDELLSGQLDFPEL